MPRGEDIKGNKSGMLGTTNIDELFAETLLGDYDDDAPWQAVLSLQKIGSNEVFARAKQFCMSSDAIVRARGIDILAQLGIAGEQRHIYVEQSKDLIVKILIDDMSEGVIVSAIHALCHLGDISAVESIVKFGTHDCPEIRYAVASGLGSFADDARVITCLLTLMDDPDQEVRDWSTFGLGVQSEADSPEIREALIARLNDIRLETRTEAMAGLAKRGDLRVLPHLLLYFDDDWISSPAVEAAMTLLGMDAEPLEWVSTDYARALREKFST